MDAVKWEGIVDQAGKAFARFGFRKTSIEDVARAAGVAKGTVYLGCQSKRDLFYQAILRDLQQWKAELSERIDPRKPADETLVEIVTGAFEIMDQHPLARDLIKGDLYVDLPDWTEHLDELRTHGVGIIVEILRIGVRQGRFRESLDIEEVAGIFLDLVTTTILYLTRDPAGEERIPRRLQAAFDVLLNGILGTEQKT